jgi:hypothetical protein
VALTTRACDRLVVILCNKRSISQVLATRRNDYHIQPPPTNLKMWFFFEKDKQGLSPVPKDKIVTVIL